MFPVACIYIPTPEHGRGRGRAVIDEDSIKLLADGVGSLSREDVLLELGHPNKRYDNDRFICYGWERIQAYIGVGAGYSGDVAPVGKVHWLCVEFDDNAKLVQVKEIVPFLWGDADKKRDATLDEWRDILMQEQ